MKSGAAKLGLSILAALAPIHGMLIAVATLLAVDLITGVWAAYKQNKAITSSGLRRTAVKLLVYEAALIMGHVAQTYLVPDIAITSIIAGYIGLTELLSIIENLNVISEQNLFKALLEKLHQTKP